jgi:hypothetical protein
MWPPTCFNHSLSVTDKPGFRADHGVRAAPYAFEPHFKGLFSGVGKLATIDILAPDHPTSDEDIK